MAAESTADSASRFPEILVYEGDRHAPLADRRGDAFDRAEAHVAAREDPGHARLQEVRVPVLPPTPARAQVGSREHVAAPVNSDLRGQPAGLRVGADEDEQAAG